MKRSQKIKANFLKYLKKKSNVNEINCFRALLKALNDEHGIVVKEFHSKSYVKFATTGDLNHLKTSAK